MKRRKRKSRLRSGKRLGVAGLRTAADAALAKKIEEEGIFSGEEMVCVVCGAQQQSDVGVESNWRCVIVGEGERYYACPDEFPPDGAGKEEFREAYRVVLVKVLSIRGKSLKEQLQ